ncbi:MAG: hypothetical protein ABEL51_14545 [Salinibacter sp.]
MATAPRYSHLVQVEAGSIQEYIFEGARLREWRGASALLDRIGRRDLYDVVEDAPVDVVRSGGGVAVLGVRPGAPDETTSDIQEEVTRLFREQAPGVRVYTASVSPSGEPASDLLARLSYEAGLRQEQSPATDSGARLLGPMTRFCDSCGLRPAEEHRRIGDDGALVCPTCKKKGGYGAAVRNGEVPKSTIRRFAEHIRQKDRQRASGWPEADSVPELVPEDLSALGETDPNGDIALVLADGNALGKTIQEIDGFDTYQSFSEEIAAAVEAAVFDTLAEHPPIEGSSEEDTIPWEIVFLGGDDILILTAASIALQVAEGLARSVEDQSAEVVKPYERDFLSLGIGVVVAGPHVPIKVLRRLAGELESSAKDLAYSREGETHAIDFHRITGEGSTTLSHIRDHVLRPERDYRDSPGAPPTRLTARPFTIGTLREVRDLAEEWATLPRSKVHALRESLFESPAEAMRSWAHVVARADDNNRSTWQKLAQLANPSAQGSPLELPWTASGKKGGNRNVARETFLLDVVDVLALENG